jgi:predicted GNAT family acetyltransferase
MTAANSAPPTIDIQHQAELQRFVAAVDGAEGVLGYHNEGRLMVISHTDVPAAIGGRGIAGQLVQAALEHARSEGWTVRPDCSYAAAWVKRHPEYASLLG